MTLIIYCISLLSLSSIHCTVVVTVIRLHCNCNIVILIQCILIVIVIVIASYIFQVILNSNIILLPEIDPNPDRQGCCNHCVSVCVIENFKFWQIFWLRVKCQMCYTWHILIKLFKIFIKDW